MKTDDLEFLFKPRNVAIVGFSLNPNKLGHLIYQNIIKGGFKGRVFLVNPKGGSYQQRVIYPKLSDIPYPLDLAIIVIPAQFVPLVVEEAVKKKVKSLIVISAGFKEVGGRGKVLEDKIKLSLKDSSTRLLGVNCLGLVSYGLKGSPLNATFLADMPPRGDISFISQSGAFGAAAIDWLLKKTIGFQYFISLGNKTDINEVDLLPYLGKDKATKVIAVYLESFSRGKKFIRIASEVSQHKPIVLLTPGTSKRAKQAAISHTGSLVSNSQVVKVAMEKSSVIQVTTIEEMFTYFLTFSLLGKKKVDRSTAIVTNAGGPAIVVSDLLDRYGFTIPQLEMKTEEHLREVLPWEANITDPVDVIGDADAQRYKVALEAVAGDRNVDNIIVVLTPQITTQVKETAEYLVELSQRTPKPIIATFIGGKRIEEGYRILSQGGVPVFDFPDNALKALKAVFDYQRSQKEKKSYSWPPKVQSFSPSLIKLAAEVKEITPPKKQINNYWFWQFLKEMSLPVVPTKFWPLDDLRQLKNKKQVEGELELISNKLDFPLVLKLAAENVSHRTEIGGVKVGINSYLALKDAFWNLVELAKEKELVGKGSYLLIQPQLKIEYELIAGLKTDPNFGHLLMVGGGGLQAELYKDVTSLLLPATKKEIEAKFQTTKVARLLGGYRGRPKYNLSLIIDTFWQISHLVELLPELKTADFNPLILNHDGLFIVDAKGYL